MVPHGFFSMKIIYIYFALFALVYGQAEHTRPIKKSPVKHNTIKRSSAGRMKGLDKRHLEANHLISTITTYTVSQLPNIIKFIEKEAPKIGTAITGAIGASGNFFGTLVAGAGAVLASPVFWGALGAAAVIGIVVYSVFHKKPLNANQMFSQIQSNMENVMDDKIKSLIIAESVDEYIAVKEQINENLREYSHQTLSGDLRAKYDFLNTFDEFLVTRVLTNPKLLVSGEMLSHNDGFYLRQHESNLCFGPRSSDVGTPYFDASDNPTDKGFHLFECSSMLKMKQTASKQYLFTEDHTSGGVYCASDKRVSSKDSSVEVMGTSTSDCGDEDSIGAIDGPNQKVIIYSQTSKGLYFLACSGTSNSACGTMDDRLCGWVLSSNVDISQNLFSSSDACYSTFEKVPVYASHSEGQLKFLIQNVPMFLKLHFGIMVEKLVLNNEESTVERIMNTVQRYRSSFESMKKIYEMNPVSGDDLSWIAPFKDIMDSWVKFPFKKYIQQYRKQMFAGYGPVQFDRRFQEYQEQVVNENDMFSHRSSRNQKTVNENAASNESTPNEEQVVNENATSSDDSTPDNE